MGVSFESWVLLYYGGFLCILGVGWGFYWVLFYYVVSWVIVGGFLCILGFMWVLGVVGM